MQQSPASHNVRNNIEAMSNAAKSIYWGGPLKFERPVLPNKDKSRGCCYYQKEDISYMKSSLEVLAHVQCLL